MDSATGIVLPPGVERPSAVDGGAAVIDNRTALPDNVVREAVQAHFVAHASVLGANPSTFQSYAAEGPNFMTRRRFETPANVFDEIKLARELATRDDDVRATIGAMLALAYGTGMENFHDDEQTTALFNEIAGNANLDDTLPRIYRELLISGSVTTVQLFTREQFEWTPVGTDTVQKKLVSAPLVGTLPAEHIRVIDSDLFAQGTLAMDVSYDDRLRKWLEEYFNKDTTPARKADMGRNDRVTAAMFTAPYEVPYDDPDMTIAGKTLYKLNPRMVSRLKMATDEKYPTPPLAANFALLEAKRLLNVMDYALLQGGANFIVVAKQGSDQRPAQQEEVDGLMDTVRRASATGVIVGDHRLSFDIITPDLKELLSQEKRRLIGRKLAYLLLRVPDAISEEESEGIKALNEIATRVIAADRHSIKRHIERVTYKEVVRRNRDTFKKGPAKLWHPAIMLSGSQWFTDFVLKLRDRGDIPRKWAVESGGFDYEAGLAQRQREIDRGDDEILTPGDIPFNSPDAGPQDNQEGRPPGASPANGAPGQQRPRTSQDPARPRRTIRRTRGETVRAWWDDELQATVRVGENTYRILEQYEDREVGRITKIEQEALGAIRPTAVGGIIAIPVNVGEELDELKIARLGKGLSMVVGTRPDEALMARALIFREPDYDRLRAEELAAAWGFSIEGEQWSETVEPEPELDDDEARAKQLPAATPPVPVVNLHIESRAGKVRKTIVRDENNVLTAVEEEPVEEPEA